MTQNESFAEARRSFARAESQFSDLGRQRVEEFITMQKDLLDRFQETHEHWCDRAQKETNLASEFASKLSASRSVPEAVAACQEWTGQRFDLMAKDGMHLFDDAQKFVDAYTRFLANGAMSSGTRASSAGASTLKAYQGA